MTSRRHDKEDIGLVQHAQTLHTLRNRSVDAGRAASSFDHRRASRSPEKQNRGRPSSSKAREKKSTGATRRVRAALPDEGDQYSSQGHESPQRQYGRRASPKRQARGGRQYGSAVGFADQCGGAPGKGSAAGKQSAMKRELDNLNLSASKQYSFLYDDSLPRGERSAMADPDQYWLRERGQSKGGRRGRRRPQHEDDDCCGCLEVLGEFSSPNTLVPLILVLAGILLYLAIFMPVQYCDNAADTPHCSPSGWYWPWECRPCPANAHCSNGEMYCLSHYQDVGGEVCLTQDDNPYIAKVVSFLLEVDEGIRWNKNFRHFGAAHPQKITADEVLAQLGARDDPDQAITAFSAIAAVFRAGGAKDQYCLANKFASQNLDDFVGWSDVLIGSLKLGWPIAPEEGAKKHN